MRVAYSCWPAAVGWKLPVPITLNPLPELDQLIRPLIQGVAAHTSWPAKPGFGSMKWISNPTRYSCRLRRACRDGPP